MIVSNQNGMTARPMNWFIKVRDTVYGPYSLARMQHFASEGRVSTRTLVSDNRDSGFGPAAGDPVLSDMLANGSPLTAPAARIHAGQRAERIFAAYVSLRDNNSDNFADELARFGQVIHPFADVWLVKGETSVDELRNVLTRNLSAEDHLVVFEVNEDRGAWFNIGQRADRQIREFFGSSN